MFFFDEENPEGERIPVPFMTSEHYYMFMKAVTFEDGDSMLAIVQAPDAKTAKALGRKVKNFDEKRWYDMSYDINYGRCTSSEVYSKS